MVPVQSWQRISWSKTEPIRISAFSSTRSCIKRHTRAKVKNAALSVTGTESGRAE